jgi:SNF2 family DNA or RNA helicase
MLRRDQLHDYQVKSISFANQHEKCALWLGLGMGKTTSTLTVVKDLSESLDINKTLIIAPLRVSNTVWHIEARKWEHLCDLTFSICTGVVKDRLEGLGKEADVYVINRENIPWLVQHYGRRWPFDCVVIDESSSFKSSKAARWKALRKVNPLIHRMIQLTGTPAANSLMDLWAQVFLLDGGKRLGKTMTAFKDRFFTSDYLGYSYELKEGSEEKIHNLVSDIVFNIPSVKHSHRTDITRFAELTPAQLKTYQQLEKEFVIELQDTEISAFNAAALTNKLLQYANGNVYDENGNTNKVHNAKIDVLKEIIEEAQGEPVLVAYNFKSDLVDLLAAFPHAEVLGKEYSQIEKWNRGEIPILLGHPQACGHGVQLEQGSSILVHYGLNWSLELYQQMVARLDRQGQKKTVRNIRIVSQGTIDEKVLLALESKSVVQTRLIDFIKSVYNHK